MFLIEEVVGVNNVSSLESHAFVTRARVDFESRHMIADEMATIFSFSFLDILE